MYPTVVVETPPWPRQRRITSRPCASSASHSLCDSPVSRLCAVVSLPLRHRRAATAARCRRHPLIHQLLRPKPLHLQILHGCTPQLWLFPIFPNTNPNRGRKKAS
ncbi:hypothetical protein SESBI_50270 [Sesbania bispinosa]|nr:hypothetical protein SESBI_50270 [Sesbania bispinosa]